MEESATARDALTQQVINTYDSNTNFPCCILLNLPTGYGKTKIALDLIKYINKEDAPMNILLLVSKIVHKEEWVKEILKWGGLPWNVSLVMECYESLKKHQHKTYDMVILDEEQHIKSELRAQLISTLHIEKLLLGLSATIPENTIQWLQLNFTTYVISHDMQKAIDEGVIPKPKIIFIPLTLDRKERKLHTVQKGTGTATVYINDLREMGRYRHQNITVLIYGTDLFYYNAVLTHDVDYWKQIYDTSQSLYSRNQWLRSGKNRLRALSDMKVPFTKELLETVLKDKRTLTFCGSIAETEKLGKYYIHSQEKNSLQNLEAFNTGEIDHITACDILNEGVNLVDCEIGIFNNIPATEIKQIQRIGRILRHENPKVIFPYFKDTREEELIIGLKRQYKDELIINLSPEEIWQINSL